MGLTAVIGTLDWFQLQAGDTGVRSIEGITLGTSLVTGAVSLMIVRQLGALGVNTAGDHYVTEYAEPGVRIYDGACILGGFYASTSTAPNLISYLQFVDK